MKSKSIHARLLIKSLCEVSDFITKGSTPTTHGHSWVEDGVLFLRSECVSDEGLDLRQAMFISNDAHYMLRRSEIRKDDLLITITGNVGRVVWFQGNSIANINQHIARIRISDDKVVNGYIYHYLSQRSVRESFEKVTTGQAYPQISLEQVRNFSVPLPPKKEQTAIAEALSDVDGLIESLEKLIAKKRAIKQATMQQLLSGKTRLPGFSGEWETKRLGDLGETVAGLTYSPDDVDVSGNLVLRSSNVQNGNLCYDDNVYVRMELPSRVMVVEDDILICVRNGSRDLIGKCALITQEAVKMGCAFGAFMSIFRSPINRYLIHVFNSDFMKAQIEAHLGATINQITDKSMKSFCVPLPEESEQTAIARVLSDMDAEIQSLESRLAKTRQIKQGMMQQLLTGRVRLVEPGSEDRKFEYPEFRNTETDLKKVAESGCRP